MTAKNEKGANPSRLVSEMLETATEMHALGITDDAAFEKIMRRHLGDTQSPIPTEPAAPIPPDL